MFCSNCGANLPDGSVFCSSCGKDLRGQSQPGTYQSAGQTGVYQSPQGYPMPPVQYKKPRNTGRIVLWSVIAAVLLTGVIVVCVLVFASPKDSPAVNVSATPKVSSTLKPTAAPSETAPAESETPTQVITGTISDFPYSFTQLNFPEADFMPKSFGSIEEFETELTANTWDYYEARNNKDAVSFNGGFINIAYNDSAQIIHEYVFSGDYTLKSYQLNVGDLSVANEYDFSYWTQASGDVYLACYNLGINTELNGVTYKAVITEFINEMGDLAECMTLYDPYKDVFVPISNYDVYKKSMAQTNNSNNNTDQEATQKQFESKLQSSVWLYSASEDAEPEMTIGEYSDISPVGPYKITFSPDMTIEYIDAATGEPLSDEAVDYAFGKNHAYVYIDQYEQDGVTYEIDLYYYIDSYGSLVEQIMAYDAAAGTYHSLSNMNIYKVQTP